MNNKYYKLWKYDLQKSINVGLMVIGLLGKLDVMVTQDIIGLRLKTVLE